jgi:hypothetical protein
MARCLERECVKNGRQVGGRGGEFAKSLEDGVELLFGADERVEISGDWRMEVDVRLEKCSGSDIAFESLVSSETEECGSLDDVLIGSGRKERIMVALDVLDRLAASSYEFDVKGRALLSTLELVVGESLTGSELHGLILVEELDVVQDGGSGPLVIITLDFR